MASPEEEEEELPLLDPDELPLCGATPEFLQDHPKLAQLLRELGETGKEPQLENELREAEAALETSLESELQWESLWRGLRELLLLPSPTLPPPVLRELELQLGPSQYKPVQATPPPAQATPPLGPILLPALERRLAEKAAELGGFYWEGEGPDEATPTPGHARHAQTGRGVAEALANQRRRLQRAQEQRPRLLRALREHRCTYQQALQRCQQLLSRLMGVAEEWAELDRGHAHYLEAKALALLHKSRWEELRLLIDSYPADTLQAHRRIRASLEEEMGVAKAELARARAELSAYQKLGPDFSKMAAEYRELQEKLEERRQTLRKLRPLAAGHAHSATPAPRPRAGAPSGSSDP